MAETTETKSPPSIEDKDIDFEDEESTTAAAEKEDPKPIVCPNCQYVIPPAGKESSAKKRVQPPWWNNEVEEAIEKKRKALKVSNRTGRASDLLTYKKANAFARYTVRNAKAKYQETLQEGDEELDENKRKEAGDVSSANGGDELKATQEKKSEGVAAEPVPEDGDQEMVSKPEEGEVGNVEPVSDQNNSSETGVKV